MEGETVYVGLGANLGDARANLAAGLLALAGDSRVRVVRAATVRDYPPVGPADQPDYANTAAELRVRLAPRELLALANAAEAAAGRDRAREIRWGPRTLDIDILLWPGRIVDEPDLRIPHPEMARRRFVLEPLAELAPGALHAPTGLTVAALLARLEA
jgi:2-amino-4-hydroxy-6-hydroxymethyldihydropteridine diphosphokinase